MKTILLLLAICFSTLTYGQINLEEGHYVASEIGTYHLDSNQLITDKYIGSLNLYVTSSSILIIMMSPDDKSTTMSFNYAYTDSYGNVIYKDKNDQYVKVFVGNAGSIFIEMDKNNGGKTGYASSKLSKIK